MELLNACREYWRVMLFIGVLLFAASALYFSMDGAVSWRLSDDLHPKRVRVIDTDGSERCYDTLNPAIWREILCEEGK